MAGLGGIRPFGKFFQHGYVTSDLDRAIAEFASRWGVSRFLIRPTAEFLCAAPTGAANVVVRLAFAYVGDLQIELIEPMGGSAATFYTDTLPKDAFAVRFHHMGFLLSDEEAEWGACIAGAAQDKYELALSGDNPRLRFAYLDSRAELGHYCEFVSPKFDVFADIPRN
jgi:hypothetical protein